MATIKIYDERFENRAKEYTSKEEAINDFLDYNATHNTAFDGKSREEIKEEISLYEISEEYFGSWGRVLCE
jgi:hypothetical protein